MSKIHLFDLERDLETDFVWGSHSAPSNNVLPATAVAIEKHVNLGYTIYIGNNPQMDRVDKWQEHDLVRLSLINDRRHGKSIRTIWAAKPK